jgi:hypothetical protein
MSTHHSGHANFTTPSRLKSRGSATCSTARVSGKKRYDQVTTAIHPHAWSRELQNTIKVKIQLIGYMLYGQGFRSKKV